MFFGSLDQVQPLIEGQPLTVPLDLGGQNLLGVSDILPIGDGNIRVLLQGEDYGAFQVYADNGSSLIFTADAELGVRANLFSPIGGQGSFFGSGNDFRIQQSTVGGKLILDGQDVEIRIQNNPKLNFSANGVITSQVESVEATPLSLIARGSLASPNQNIQINPAGTGRINIGGVTSKLTGENFPARDFIIESSQKMILQSYANNGNVELLPHGTGEIVLQAASISTYDQNVSYIAERTTATPASLTFMAKDTTSQASFQVSSVANIGFYPAANGYFAVNWGPDSPLVVAKTYLNLGSAAVLRCAPRIVNMTTTQIGEIATPQNGMIVYNSTLHKLQLRENGAWVTFTTT